MLHYTSHRIWISVDVGVKKKTNKIKLEKTQSTVKENEIEIPREENIRGYGRFETSP